MSAQFDTFRGPLLATATRQFYRGLDVLTAMPDPSADLGESLIELLVDRPDLGEQFRGILNFLELYTRADLDTALDAVEDGQGIPVRVLQSGGYQRGDFDTPGNLAGLLSADTDQRGRYCHFLGVAVTRVGESEKVPVQVHVSPLIRGFVRKVDLKLPPTDPG